MAFEPRGATIDLAAVGDDAAHLGPVADASVDALSRRAAPLPLRGDRRFFRAGYIGNLVGG